MNLLCSRQAPVAMWFSTRLAGTQLTFFAGLRATSGATNRQCQLLFRIHVYTMQQLLALKMLNSEQFARLSPLFAEFDKESFQTNAGEASRSIGALALATARNLKSRHVSYLAQTREPPSVNLRHSSGCTDGVTAAESRLLCFGRWWVLIRSFRRSHPANQHSSSAWMPTTLAAEHVSTLKTLEPIENARSLQTERDVSP